MFVLRMYGLEGCPACQQALDFIKSKNVPFEAILANGDPIIAAGNKALSGGEDKYPILVCNLINSTGTKDIIMGFKVEDYDRICKAVGVFLGAGAWDVSRSGQQSDGENSAPPAETAAGAN